MTPVEAIEIEHARGLPAWTILKVRDPLTGWRHLTAHEICVLHEMFDLWEGEDFRRVGYSLGLIIDETDDADTFVD